MAKASKDNHNDFLLASMSCGFTISNLLIPKAVQSNTASPYGKQLRYNKCSTKTCETILDVVAGDKVKNNAYQDAEIW